MRVVLDKGLSAGWLVSKILPPELTGTFFLKGTFKLAHGGAATPIDDPDPPNGDVPSSESDNPGIVYENDFAPFKLKADVLVTGSCYPPGGKPVGLSQCTIKVGPVNKSVLVFGDRVWHRGVLSSSPGEPAPFSKMPLIYENAFGGPGYDYNPAGKGISGDLMPNIEERGSPLASRSGRPSPAGFGPLHRTWRPRSDRPGTFDKKWLKERWPWFPEDFNWDSFNAAPLDQRVKGYLRGDEALYFENMHPKHAQYSAKLPSLRARCFLQEKRGGKKLFREVALNLDTLWVNTDEEKLILVWRGRIDVLSIKLKEVDYLFGIMEKLGEDVPAPLWQADLERREKPPLEEPEPDNAAEAAEAKAEQEAWDKEFAALDAEFAKAQADAAKQSGDLASLNAQFQAGLNAGGNDAALFKGAPPPASPTTPTEFAKLYSELQGQARTLNQQGAPTNVKLPPGATPPQLPMQGAPPANFSIFDEPKEEPEEAPEQPWTRERVQQAHASGHDFREHYLVGLDLSGLDLSGGKFAEAMLSKAKLNSCKLAGADFSGASLIGAELKQADLSGANLLDANFSKSAMDGAIFAEASLTDATFSQCKLDKSDFTKAQGEGASFTKASLKEAKFAEAKFVSCNFDESVVEKADFRKAQLANCSFETAIAKGADFSDGDLTGFRGGEKSDFSEAKLLRAKAAKSAWPDANLGSANFGGAELSRAIFSGAKLDKANLSGVNAAKADFSDASLQGASLLGANLLRANFERCDLSLANLESANCYEAEFWEAKTTGANLNQAALKQTKLEHA